MIENGVILASPFSKSMYICSSFQANDELSISWFTVETRESTVLLESLEVKARPWKPWIAVDSHTNTFTNPYSDTSFVPFPVVQILRQTQDTFGGSLTLAFKKKEFLSTYVGRLVNEQQ